MLIMPICCVQNCAPDSDLWFGHLYVALVMTLTRLIGR